MSDAPHTDWDMLHHWEWARRSAWQPGFRHEPPGPTPARAFAEVCGHITVEAALDAACGLGRRSLVLQDYGINILGADISGTAIEHARQLARAEDSPVTFFASPWEALPCHAPHQFDAILNTALGGKPTWDGLKAALAGLFVALKPGGFLMFRGVGENDPPDALRRDQKEAFAKDGPETLDWFHRDGGLSCARLRLRTKAPDYIDERFVHVIHQDGESRLEATSRRRPAYWTWEHWEELTAGAGFCHLETRAFGEDESLRMNVAWKSGEGAPAVDENARRAPYQA